MIDRVLKPVGATRSQWWVTAFLSRCDGMPQVTLADELDIGKVALGGLIDRLQNSGFVQRRPDLQDRRVKRVYLTKQGNKLLKIIRENTAGAERLIHADIKDAYLEFTATVLRAMKVNLLPSLGNTAN